MLFLSVCLSVCLRTPKRPALGCRFHEYMIISELLLSKLHIARASTRVAVCGMDVHPADLRSREPWGCRPCNMASTPAAHSGSSLLASSADQCKYASPTAVSRLWKRLIPRDKILANSRIKRCNEYSACMNHMLWTHCYSDPTRARGLFIPSTAKVFVCVLYGYLTPDRTPTPTHFPRRGIK